MSGLRFRYSLEAPQLRARHALDEAVQKAADSRRELQADQETQRRLLDELQQVGSASTQASDASLDPVRAMVRMDYLIRLRQRAARLEGTIESKRKRLAEAVETLKACQRDCEKFERHRAQQLTLHRQAISAREAVDADNAWITRLGWKQLRRPEDDVELVQ